MKVSGHFSLSLFSLPLSRVFGSIHFSQVSQGDLSPSGWLLFLCFSVFPINSRHVFGLLELIFRESSKVGRSCYWIILHLQFPLGINYFDLSFGIDLVVVSTSLVTTAGDLLADGTHVPKITQHTYSACMERIYGLNVLYIYLFWPTAQSDAIRNCSCT